MCSDKEHLTCLSKPDFPVQVNVPVCCTHDNQIRVDRDVLIDTNGVNALIKDRIIVVLILQGHGQIDAGCIDKLKVQNNMSYLHAQLAAVINLCLKFKRK